MPIPSPRETGDLAAFPGACIKSSIIGLSTFAPQTLGKPVIAANCFVVSTDLSSRQCGALKVLLHAKLYRSVAISPLHEVVRRRDVTISGARIAAPSRASVSTH